MRAEPADPPQTIPVPETILVYVGLDLLGDGLMKLPFVWALRRAFPKARITWLAGKGKSAFAGVLKPMVAASLDEVIEDAGIGLHLREAVARPLPGRRFDLILDTQRRASTTLAVKRIRHERFISGCAGYLFSDARPPGALPFAHRKPPAMVDQMLELVAMARAGRPDAPVEYGGGLPRICDAIESEAARLLPDGARRQGARYVAIAPGAGVRRKCWPLENFMALARRLEGRGLVPAFILGPNERPWFEALREGVPGAAFPLSGPDASPMEGPLLSIALAARCRAGVANDSGGGHILAASGRPLVSLFGPTSPAKFAPRIARLTIVEASAFGGREMSAIPVPAVEAAVLEALGS